MKDDTMSKLHYDNQRKKRVKRLKRMLIIFIVILILIPIIMSIFLAIRVKSLQEQIDFLYEAGPSTIYEARQNNSSAENGTDESVYDTVTIDDEEKMQGIVAVNEQVLGDVKNSGEIPQKQRLKVYLTFDDGPSENTEKILDILNQYGVKATFFVIGKEGEDYKRLYRRIVDEGNTIGMHSYSHQYSTIYESLDSFKADFYRIQNYIYEVTGYKPVYYRFPGGSNNQVTNTDIKELIKFLNQEKVTYFDWNASSGDAASKGYSVDELVGNVIESMEKDSDSIVLMHDTNAKGTTVEALTPLLERLKGMDVDIVPIDENTKPVQLIKADEITE